MLYLLDQSLAKAMVEGSPPEQSFDSALGLVFAQTFVGVCMCVYCSRLQVVSGTQPASRDGQNVGLGRDSGSRLLGLLIGAPWASHLDLCASTSSFYKWGRSLTHGSLVRFK